jgi:hypothetical protein
LNVESFSKLSDDGFYFSAHIHYLIQGYLILPNNFDSAFMESRTLQAQGSYRFISRVVRSFRKFG